MNKMWRTDINHKPQHANQRPIRAHIVQTLVEVIHQMCAAARRSKAHVVQALVEVI